MAAWLKIILLCVLVTQDDAKSTQDQIDELTGRFNRYVTENLAKQAIGLKEMENWIKGERVMEGIYLKGTDIITKLAQDLTKRLNNKRKAVQDIATNVNHALASGKKATKEYYQCCEIPVEMLTYDPRFKDKITEEIFCTMKAPNHLQTYQMDFREVRTAFDKNLKKSSLKVRWQYYGSAEGILTGYPGARVSDCHSYDNRLRPWYVTTATPSPKNIIILLDCSTSMGVDNNLEDAKDTAKTVLNTLNPEDKVSVILFNVSTFLSGDQTQNRADCYNSTMAYAGTFNIRNLKSLLSSAQPKGGTRFIKAFKKAFQILRHTFNTSAQSIVTRPSMILLLTDETRRKQVVEDIVIQAVRKEFEMFRSEFKQASLKLMSLRFGNDKKQESFLDKLTREMNGTLMSAQGKNDAHSKLKPYFDYLMKVTPASSNNVVFSPPYVDAWGLGYMITAASAVLDQNNKLRGVAGVDIPMTDLVSDIQYFKQGSGAKSYAFLVHTRTGIVLSHPKLPTPESVTQDPNAVNILELEQAKEFKDLFKSLQKSQRLEELDINGQLQSMPRGGVLGDGAKTIAVNYRYYCQPLDVGNKEYTVCIAIEKNDHTYLYKLHEIRLGAGTNPTTYHRIDVFSEAKTCYHMDTLSYADRSVIKLSAKAFRNPSNYFEEEESLSAVQRYAKELLQGKNRPEFEHESVLNKDIQMIAELTSHIDSAVWGSVDYKDFTSIFVRRYIGTYSGVLRIFPGAPLPTGFDHVTRPWFMSAVANEGLVTLTHPYLDPLGAGFVVSISHSIKTKHSLEKQFGVVGGDLTVATFGAMWIKRMGKGCADHGKLRCFLMDTAGYIVYHPTFENVFNDSSKIIDKHITQMDEGIAMDLIKNKMMKRRACQNFNLLNLQRFYEVDIGEEFHKGTFSTPQGQCKSYAIARLRNTNVFAVSVDTTACLFGGKSCPCQDICTSDDDQFCECPCKTRLDYDICNANITGGRGLPVCAPPSPPLSPRKPLPAHPDDLGECIRANCGQYTSKHDCNEIFGCVWCHKQITDGSLLDHQSCKRDRECFGGELGRPNPFLLPFKPRKPKKRSKLLRILGVEFSLTTLIAAASGVGCGILLIIIIICCLYKRNNKWEVEFDDMEMFEPELTMMEYADQTQSTMHMGQRQSAMHMGQRQSAMHMGQRQSAMQMNHRQSAMHMGQRQSTMQMGQRQSAMHMGQRQPTMQMGQRPSAMQMRGAPGVQYSQQAMSAMWSQSRKFPPQASNVQRHGAMTKRAPAITTIRKVSFSADTPEVHAENGPSVAE